MLNRPHTKHEVSLKLAASPRALQEMSLKQDFDVKAKSQSSLRVSGFHLPFRESFFDSADLRFGSMREELGRLGTLRSKSSRGLLTSRSSKLSPTLLTPKSALSSRANTMRMRVMLKTADNLILQCRRNISPTTDVGRLLDHTETGIRKSVNDILCVGSIKLRQNFNISRKKFLEDDNLLTKNQITRMIKDARMKIKKVKGQVE